MMMTSKVGYGKLAKDLFSKEIAEALAGARNVFIAQFTNLSVNNASELRKNLRKTRTRFLVVKNSLGRRALVDSPFKGLAQMVDGQCGLGITSGDVSKVSKILVGFSDENAGFKVNGAYIDGQVYASEAVKRLSALPSREELLSKMLRGLNAPMSGLVSVLNEVLAGIVHVLDQIRKSKEK